MIFGGFSAEAIAERNNDSAAKVVLTADGGWRRGKQLPLKENVDIALQNRPRCKNASSCAAPASRWQ